MTLLDKPKIKDSDATIDSLLALKEQEGLTSEKLLEAKRILTELLTPQGSFLSMMKESWLTLDSILFIVKSSIRIAIILMLSFCLWKISDYVIQKYASKILKNHKKTHQQHPLLRTLIPITRSVLHWVSIILTSLLILTELNINVMPILLSFSVIGLAFSIGSQNLVKDLINGVMTLLEGNMTVGDVVKIGERSGKVESISLRCVYLRHANGNLETIPFSEVSNIVNISRDYAFPSFMILLDYHADLHEVEKAFHTVFDHLRTTQHMWGHLIQGPLNFLGVKSIDEHGIWIKANVKTCPNPEETFVTHFNSELLTEIQKRNIPLPSPK